MKNLLLLLACVLVGHISNAQLIQAEYNWDNGPAQTISAQDGSMDEMVETLIHSDANVPSEAGVHLLSLRVKDVYGNWGPYHSQVIYIEDFPELTHEQKLIQAEYNWDNGPATSIAVMDNTLDNAIEAFIKTDISMSEIGTGMHLLNLRVKGEDGNWGPYHARAIYVEPFPELVHELKLIQAEYNWDNGPATSIAAMDSTLDNAIEAFIKTDISTSVIDSGFHLMNIRVKGADNNWGPYHSQVIYVEPLPNLEHDLKLVQAEYNWDNGPSTQISALDGTLDNALEQFFKDPLITDDVGEGLHLFNLRVKGNEDQWGPYFSQVLYFEPCASPPLYLGRDTLICYGESVTINAGPGFSEYVWNTGEETSSIEVTEAGTYSVEVTHVSGCRRRDEIEIDFHEPVRLIENDTTLCQGETVVLHAETFIKDITWNGVSGENTLTISEANTYVVEVTEKNCSSRDSMTFTLWELPVVDLGEDVFQCEDNTVVLDAGSGYSSYKWYGGTSPTRYLSTDTSGTYVVEVSNVHGCISQDTIEVSIGEYFTVDLGPDQQFCEGESIVLDAGDGYSSYEWEGIGSSERSIEVTEAGQYIVTVEVGSSCEGRDTIELTRVDLPIAAFSYMISSEHVEFTNTSQNAEGYYWDFGDGSFSSQESPTHNYETGGLYDVSLNATNICGADSLTQQVNFLSTNASKLNPSTISVHPNPNSGQMILDLGIVPDNKVMITVSGTNGQIIDSWFLSDRYLEINGQNWSAGIYYLTVIDDQESSVLKLVVQQ